MSARAAVRLATGRRVGAHVTVLPSLGLGPVLRDAVQAQRFEDTPDGLTGAPVEAFPNLDLALVVFPGSGAAPRWGNVLFSREHPSGHVARIPPDAGAVEDVLFLRDERDASGTSWLWQPGARWEGHLFTPLAGRGPERFVAPYPASLLKLMVAVGVGLAVDAGRARWPGDAVEAMITVSSNEATDEMVALLHRVDGIGPLHAAFARFGLVTLRLEGTTPAGGWRNPDGSGVGMIHMTAWDTVRLLWLLDADAPAPPWAPNVAPLLRPPTRDRLRAVLGRQQLDEVLSSGSLRALPGWVDGIPARARYAHKTGTTENYASDAGIVHDEGRDGPLHYIVAVLTNLGERYAPHPDAATTWKLPALGAALHALAAAAR